MPLARSTIAIVPSLLKYNSPSLSSPCSSSRLTKGTLSLILARNMSSNHPTRPPKKNKRKRYTGLIWPKDPSSKPHSQSSATPTQHSRLFDLLTSRGPDIFLGNTTSPRTPRSTWSNWSHITGKPPKKTISFLPWPFPRYKHTRPPTQLYDFAARRYKEWTPEWHLAEYPCAYCCCVPWRDCKHGEGRGKGREMVLGASVEERGGKCKGGWYDESLWEGREHRCGCEDCRINAWKQWREWQQQQQKHHDRINIADYRCDGLS